ncbi:spore coat protein GerQ [Paenibacillus albiflavus]
MPSGMQPGMHWGSWNPGMHQGMGMQSGMQPGMQMPPNLTSSGNMMTPPGNISQLPLEQSFIENILRQNLGKMGTFYYTYENNKEWNAKIFKGVIEAAGRDHLIISDPNTGMRYLLLMVNFDYATFEEPLNYTYPYPGVIGNPPPKKPR